MKIATAKSKTSTNWVTKDWTWGAFVDRLRSPHRTPETMREYKNMKSAEKDKAKDCCGGFVGGALKSGSRKTDQVLYRSMITLDADCASQTSWSRAVSMLECQMACYSTHSSTPSAPRLRFIIPTDRDMSPDEYPAVARQVASLIGIEQMDPSTYETSRLMYWPTVSSDAEYIFRETPGDPLCVDDILSMYGDGEAWKDSSLWPIASKEQEIRKRACKQAGDPTEKEGIIGQFCRTYDIYSAIDTFLSDVYEEISQDRYTYVKGTTAGGAVIIDGRFLYSFHATDPAQGNAQNAFDLVRIHKFGDLDPYVWEGDVTRKPSYRAMCDWVLSLPEVKATIAAERMSISSAAETELGTEEQTETAAGEQDDLSWAQELEIGKDGKLKPTINNFVIIMSNDKNLKGLMGWNVFAETPIITRMPPWKHPGKFVNGMSRWTDADYASLQGYLEKVWGLNNEKNAEKALKIVQLDVMLDPLKDYLNSLEWDGTPRLETVFCDYLGADDSFYVRTVTRKWMTAAVARALNPGCKFDCAIILSGPQGIGKSTFASIISKGFFVDSAIQIGNKDGYSILNGRWIIEMAELAYLKKCDVESVKNYISQRSSVYRPAYARYETEVPRTCVFFGTTNSAEILTDPTGSRRFWPIKVQKSVDFKRLEDEIDQIWAEAVVNYRKGTERLWLSTDAEVQAWKDEVSFFTVQRDTDHIVENFLDTPLPHDFYKWEWQQRQSFFHDRLPERINGVLRRDIVSRKEIRVECFDKSMTDVRGQKWADPTETAIAEYLDNSDGCWEKVKKGTLTVSGGYKQQWCYVRTAEGKRRWNEEHPELADLQGV